MLHTERSLVVSRTTVFLVEKVWVWSSAFFSFLFVESDAFFYSFQDPPRCPGMSDHTGLKPAAWPRERTLSLAADPPLLRALAAAPLATTCGHATPAGQPLYPVTFLTPGAAAAQIECCACFEAQRAALERAQRAALPLLPAGRCGICSAAAEEGAPLRDPGSGFPMCDACFGASISKQLDFDAKYQPDAAVVPDPVLSNVLFISAKDGQANRATLSQLGISRVLICCDKLPVYHDVASSGLRFHRLAMQDSLVQNLQAYLPSALAFIAEGALAGERTLVHCNAGISRSGAVVLAFLRAAVPLSTSEAFAAAMGARARISPNTNFLKQLGYAPPEAEGASPAAAPRCANAPCPWYANLDKPEWGGLCSGCRKALAGQ